MKSQFVFGSLIFGLLFLAMNHSGSSSTPGWPTDKVVDIVTGNSYGGGRERCFCADTQVADILGFKDLPFLEKTCFDGQRNCPNCANIGSATVLGSSIPNATTQKIWIHHRLGSHDLGRRIRLGLQFYFSPECNSVGNHILSIPNDVYYKDCCTMDGKTPSFAAAIAEFPAGSQAICGLLSDLVRGGLGQIPRLGAYDSCRAENEGTPRAAAAALRSASTFGPTSTGRTSTPRPAPRACATGPWTRASGPRCDETRDW